MYMRIRINHPSRSVWNILDMPSSLVVAIRFSTGCGNHSPNNRARGYFDSTGIHKKIMWAIRSFHRPLEKLLLGWILRSFLISWLVYLRDILLRSFPASCHKKIPFSNHCWNATMNETTNHTFPPQPLLYRPQWTNVLKRFLGHVVLVAGIMGLLSFEWWDNDDDKQSVGGMWTIKIIDGMVDPTSPDMFRKADTLWTDAEGMAVLEVWVSGDGHNDTAANRSTPSILFEKLETISDHEDRSLAVMSWKWTLFWQQPQRRTTTDPSVGGSIPGCPHCGQIDDDDIFIVGRDLDESDYDITWKGYRLELSDTMEPMLPKNNEDRRRHRRRLQGGANLRGSKRPSLWWYVQHYEKHQEQLQEQLCHEISKIIFANYFKEMGVVVNAPLVVDDMEGDNDSATFHPMGDQLLWHAVYGYDGEASATFTPTDQQHNNGSILNMCKLDFIVPPRTVDAVSPDEDKVWFG
jgi:hypothetical protein